MWVTENNLAVNIIISCKNITADPWTLGLGMQTLCEIKSPHIWSFSIGPLYMWSLRIHRFNQPQQKKNQCVNKHKQFKAALFKGQCVT